ncbi:bifunctional metallophosphatase/5'-nucleotidase [Bacillus kwashiorkori]|uniref:bifunctional metallophosphatase/5'-nucleotidase n=1 Tax=Bacillus kwashiorkori TaxID=1522318 RepID=UPI00078494B4|nr:bifunctional UDP-sugar hydrolase/5'-nucleotidase [Bacillus kwashiorkori]
MFEKIVIYHTNDLHSHFKYWPRIEQSLIRERNEIENEGRSMFLFDIGDHVDRFHPFTEATLGQGNIQLMNKSGYNAVTIGNNEGITLAHEHLDTLYKEATFDCVLLNLYKLNGNRPNWLKPYQVFQTNSGVKVGVTGVTINYTSFYEPLDWKITDPFEELATWLPVIREQVDILIVLSHLGLTDDERIANEFPYVDVILGGHTHHLLPNGKIVNNSLLCCTGKFGFYLGKVELLFDKKSRKLTEKHASLIDTKELPETSGEEQYNSELEERGRKLLSQPVAFLPKRLETNWFQETEFNNLLCRALTEWCDADCSFINAGILIDDLQQGIVTEYDIHQICPHPINPCTIKLQGSELKEVILQTLEDKYTTLELKGFGFRGKVFGKIIYDNLTFTGEGAAIQIYIKGEPLIMDELYTVATIDMFAFAKFYPSLIRKEKNFFLPEFIRDILKWKLRIDYPCPSSPYK